MPPAATRTVSFSSAEVRSVCALPSSASAASSAFCAETTAFCSFLIWATSSAVVSAEAVSADDDGVDPVQTAATSSPEDPAELGEAPVSEDVPADVEATPETWASLSLCSCARAAVRAALAEVRDFSSDVRSSRATTWPFFTVSPSATTVSTVPSVAKARSARPLGATVPVSERVCSTSPVVTAAAR